MDLYFPPVVQSAYKNKKNTLIRHNLQNIKKLITLIILPTTTQLSLTTVCDAVTSFKVLIYFLFYSSSLWHEFPNIILCPWTEFFITQLLHVLIKMQEKVHIW